MGVLLFLVPQPDRLTAAATQRAHVVGIDGVPWPSRNALQGERLTVRRTTSESGQLLIEWPLPGRGCLALSTASLREAEQPYNLPVELARGTVGRLRDQVATWTQAGLLPSTDLTGAIRSASHQLAEAVTSQSRPLAAAERAEAAILQALEGIDRLTAEYACHAMRQRAKEGTKVTVLLGANLGSADVASVSDDLLSTFNTAVVPFRWNEVEGTVGDDQWHQYEAQVTWCRKHGVRVCAGPLLSFHREWLPDWLYLWEDDPDALQSYMVRHVQSVAEQFLGKVQLWHCWSALNNGQAMAFSEEFRLRVGVAALEALRRIDPTSPVIVSFDQPWGEYLGRKETDLTPLHYADTLVRAGLGLSGLGLEINLGYWPHGSLPRDLLEFSRLIDRFSVFGLPLVILMTVPSRQRNDGHSSRSIEVLASGSDQINVDTQAQVTDQLSRLFLSKPIVQGIFWSQLTDRLPHRFPHGGLYDHHGTAKPAVQVLRELRQSHPFL
jgi:hypothetical protein